MKLGNINQQKLT